MSSSRWSNPTHTTSVFGSADLWLAMQANMWPRTLRVAAPDPHERIRQCLLEDAAVTVARGQAEDEAVVVALGFERGRGAFARHHPIVMGFLRIFRAKIVFGHVGEDAQWLLLTIFNEL